MTEEDALIAAILATPEDRTARMVFADWLDEHGSSDQAEVIRIRCALAELSEHDELRVAWDHLESELSERHRRGWVEQSGLPL